MIYALCSGINKYDSNGDTSNNLQFCVGDAQRLSKTLESFTSKVKILDCLTDEQATAKNIFKKLGDAIPLLKTGDTLLFTYSGHGAQVPDTSGDETDKLDEVMCTYGFDWQTEMIKDDDWNRFSNNIKSGVKFELILDCCHSGTGTRGIDKYVRSMQMPIEMMQQLNLKKSITQMKTKSSVFYRQNPNEVLWAGCKSDQYSYEDYFPEIKTGSGLLTYFMIDALTKYSIDASRSTIYSHITNSIKNLKKYPQTPQLECGMFKKMQNIFS